jgi:hypothetical protein
MFPKRVYANDRWWLEGSVRTMPCCLAAVRSFNACYVYADICYDHHAESIRNFRIGLWPFWKCCCMSNGHWVSTGHLWPRVRVMYVMVHVGGCARYGRHRLGSHS